MWGCWGPAGVGASSGECPWGAGAAPSPPLSAHSKLTRESGTDFPIPVIPPVPDVETEKLIREKDEEVSVGQAERPNLRPHSLQPTGIRSHPSAAAWRLLLQPAGSGGASKGSSLAAGGPSLSGMLNPSLICTGAACLGLGTIHDPGSAPFQLRRMQEMLQKIQKQMKDSH